ncbi:alpha/beta fold hydrolase [Streptomyces sp. NPDC087300]|uniref:alpha/beta fold hydrolase n=1 Tax=Streptomyces sp. NPDC087300 TaxID=3365780 RepID=UPI0038278769
MADPVTHKLATNGAEIQYDIRGPLSGTADGARVLVLIGSPMDASGFASLASHFTDRTVVTYDPRGVGRSARTDGVVESTPEEHADDVRQVIEALGVGPVDLFASSGGAVNALALVARHPGLVHTLVAHEPPTAQVLPDRDTALAVCLDLYETYQREGMGPAMAKFIGVTSWKGPFQANWRDQPVAAPADFGLSAEDDGSRDDALFGQNLRGCAWYQPDFDALGAASTHLVIAAGEESEGEFPARAAAAIAARLGGAPTIFPSHHAGFLGGEFGQQGAPEDFARMLREVFDTHR